jgi:hypothetical protein
MEEQVGDGFTSHRRDVGIRIGLGRGKSTRV